MSARIVVVGQAGRDLILRSAEIPKAGGSEPVTERIEQLGGKGANQAVALRQLHESDPSVQIVLLGVLGQDAPGDVVFDQATASGLDTSCVVRRGRTALFVDLVATDGVRLLEDVPPDALLTAEDVHRSAAVLRAADAVTLQLQQPAAAVMAAARTAAEGHALIVLDGAITGPDRDDLLALADVVRADAHEASLLTQMPVQNRDDAVRAARSLLGPRTKLVAFGVPGEGDVVAWAHGDRFFPHSDDVIDPTGGGDAFTAGLVAALLRGEDPAAAGRAAALAAADTVKRVGGRPNLGGAKTMDGGG